MNLNWAELADVAEVISAIAVVISLIYLGRQISGNNAALRAANAATVQANFQMLASLYTVDREAGELVTRGLELDGSLTRAERAAANAWFFNCLKAGELAYRQYFAKQLDAEVWDVTLVHFRVYWESPGMRQYWSRRKHSFIPAFRAAMEQWLAETNDGALMGSTPISSDSTGLPPAAL